MRIRNATSPAFAGKTTFAWFHVMARSPEASDARHGQRVDSGGIGSTATRQAPLKSGYRCGGAAGYALSARNVDPGVKKGPAAARIGGWVGGRAATWTTISPTPNPSTALPVTPPT